MLTGSCLCGQVRYEIDGLLRHITHCHCGMCRRAHGAAFATYANVSRRRFRLLASATLREYHSSDHATRQFCSACGSPVFFVDDRYPDALSLSLGTLDGDPGGRAVAHTHVSTKATWYEIHDNLPHGAGEIAPSRTP